MKSQQARVGISAIIDFSPTGKVRRVLLNAQSSGGEDISEQALDRFVQTLSETLSEEAVSKVIELENGHLVQNVRQYIDHWMNFKKLVESLL